MLLDVGQRFTVPPEIAITSLRTDLVLWSNSLELIVPWEDAEQEAFERKKLEAGVLKSSQ